MLGTMVHCSLTYSLSQALQLISELIGIASLAGQLALGTHLLRLKSQAFRVSVS